MTMEKSFRGNLVDIDAEMVRPVEIRVRDARIEAIEALREMQPTYLLPGFIDSHIHIESSMLTVGEFARAAVIHGTIATVSDPHEIANVMGESGVEFMLKSAQSVPLKIFFGVPSCVPATLFETAGGRLDATQVARLLDDPRLRYLSEMMNFPGVLAGDAEVLAKLKASAERGKPIDGHAPGLRGANAAAYVAAGIKTDHECTTREEAVEKLAAGCKIQIREGSAARNFAALVTLIDEYPKEVMFCSDDRHPDDLLVGHVNRLVRDAIAAGQSLFATLRCACRNPVEHYQLPVGQLRVGDWADLIEVDNLTSFCILRTVIDGQVVAQNGEALFPVEPVEPINTMRARRKRPADFEITAPAACGRLRVIEAIDGELVTKSATIPATIAKGKVVSDPTHDILKLVVVNRYADAPPALAMIRGFGLRQGAIASSVAHDCHNLVAVGVTDEAIARAVNLLVDAGGGLSLVDGEQERVLPLPIAGLMSLGTCEDVAAAQMQLNEAAFRLGSTLKAPFMTLSFMSLLVIPSLKLSDQGLFDGERFEFVPLFC